MNKVLEEYIDKFKMLTSDEVKIIKELTIAKEYKKGTQLIKEGDTSHDGYLLLQGCIREYFLKDRIEKTTAIFLEGDPVNQYMGNEPSKHNYVCVEDCIVTTTNEKFENQLRKRIPRLDAVIQQQSIETMARAKDEMSLFMVSTPEERYVHLLETRPQILERIPQHQIASFIGVTPESLSRLRSRINAKRNNKQQT